MLPRLVASLCAFCLLASGCSEVVAPSCSGTDRQLETDGKLTVAADYSYPPFAFRDSDGDLTGFEVELIREVAKQMKLEAAFVNRGAGALVTGLLAHRHDVAASGLRASEDLEEQACLSSSYMEADLGVLAPASAAEDYSGVRDLRSRTVAVLDRSEAERWALAELGGSTVASLPTTDDLLTALQQNRADAVVADMPFARFSADRSEDLAVGFDIDTDQSYVFVTAKDNAPLMDELNAALGEVLDSPRFRELERRWFGG